MNGDVFDESITNVGELIRVLSYWCPDTRIDVTQRNSDMFLRVTGTMYEDHNDNYLTLIVE